MPAGCARKLGLDEVLIPPGAGVGSAIGFLKAPFSFEATRGLFQRLDAFDPDAVNGALREMEAEANAFVDHGAAGMSREVRLTALMRYAGQGWEIPVTLPHRGFAPGDEGRLLAAFEDAYRLLFGRTIDGLAVEVTNWQLAVSTVLPPVQRATRHDTGAAAEKTPHPPVL